ncbi:hypothetical protein K525DRAFT_245807 [Schizophyllum commune Loenen D]|nr:hypothetical protein K525DRAFT_245807 [Schizophyllum commune Loenen D]
MNRLMRRTTAMLFLRSNRADTDDHRNARGTHEVAQEARAHGTTTAGPDDDQAPTPSTNSARATGQRGYHGTNHAFPSRLSRLFHPRRQGRSARELRALVQIQREQADDLRSLARNSDQLASLEGSLAETIRSSLCAMRGSFASTLSSNAIAPSAAPAFATAYGFSGNNVRESRASAPAVLGQAHMEASPAAPRNSGDKDEDSSESFYTPGQSFSDDRDDASLNDGFVQDSSSASDDELDHSALLAANNVTYVFVYRINVANEAFSGVRLVIQVDRGLAPQTTRLAKAMIHSAFSGLHRLRIEGQTVSSRVTLFPLRRLRHVEIVMDISEEDVMTIMHSCPVLDVLVVTSTQTASNSCPVENYVQTSEDPAHPMVLQLNGDHFGLDLLRVVPTYVDLRLTLSPASPHLEDIRRFLDSREYTISPLRIDMLSDAGPSR